MISATNGYDVANRQAIRDKWDIGSIKVKVLGNSLVSNSKPKSSKPIVKNERITDNRRKSRTGYKERLAHQQAVLKDYLSWYTKSNKWKALAYNCDVKVCSSHFHLILDGVCTISNKEKWDAVEKSIAKIKKEMGIVNDFVA